MTKYQQIIFCFFIFRAYTIISVSTRTDSSCSFLQREINKYVKGSYKNDPLTYETKSLKETVPESYSDNFGNYIVIDKNSQKVENLGQTKIGIPPNFQHLVYPGALLKANKRLLQNTPDFVAIRRAPMRYNVDLPGMVDAANFLTIPTYGNYKKNVDNILENWFKNNKDYGFNIQIFNSKSFVRSRDQLMVDFGIGFKNVFAKLNIDFDGILNKEKLVMIHRFDQIYYTVSTAPPVKPAKILSCNVTLDQVKEKFSKDPVIVVGSVGYGRQIYVMTETSSTDKHSEFFLKNKLSFVDTDSKSNENFNKTLKNFNVKVFVLGGNKDHIEAINTKSPRDVNDIITKYNVLTANSPAFPLYYTALYVGSNEIVHLKGIAQVVDYEKSLQPGRHILVVNDSDYPSRWNLSFVKVNKDYNGNMKKERVLRLTTLPHKGSIGFFEICGNCKNVTMVVRIKDDRKEWEQSFVNIPMDSELRRFDVFATGLGKPPRTVIDPPLETSD